MRWLRGMAAAMAVLATVMGLMVVTTSGAAAEPAGCAGQDALGNDDVLRPGRALCNGNYLLRMQENGDLVLRQISTGRVCKHWPTGVPGASATVRADSTGVTLLVGSQEIATAGDGTNANLNSKGEFWVGYDRIGWC
jgi:hypothetical protein